MDTTFDTKRFESDKLVLLGLFILSLVIAGLIVSVRSAIPLSEPIELPYTGLAISIPSGSGWHSDKQWQYGDNEYTLQSLLLADSGKPIATVYCQYNLAAEVLPPQAWFNRIASVNRAVILQIEEIQHDQITIYRADIQQPEMLFSVYGMVRLSSERLLTIEVHQFSTDIGMAENIFENIVDHLRYEDNQLLSSGEDIIAQLKNQGLDSFLNSTNRKSSFLIKDQRQRSIGFSIDMIIETENNTQSNIEAISHLYQRNMSEREMIIRVNNDLTEFSWNSNLHNVDGRSITNSITNINLNRNGVMSIRQPGLRSERNLYPGPAAIPNFLFEFLIDAMFDSKYNEFVIDIIDSKGQIIPVFVSSNKVEDDDVANAYLIEIKYLNENGFSEQLYIDKQMQITKSVVQRNQQYIFESVPLETIADEFPERAEIVLQMANISIEGIL